MTEAIKIEGLTELINGFKKADAGLGREVRGALRDSGEVVRADAQGRARREIRNIGEVWPRMRLGITSGNVVYVVPKTKRSKATRRANLGKLLMDRALDPALAENIDVVERDLEAALENVNQNAGLTKSLHNLRGA